MDEAMIKDAIKRMLSLYERNEEVLEARSSNLAKGIIKALPQEDKE